MIARGWPAATPAAIVQAAASAKQRVWIGTLAELGAAPIDVELPGVIVIGDVVKLAREHDVALAVPEAGTDDIDERPLRAPVEEVRA
jgi:siroheme synthase